VETQTPPAADFLETIILTVVAVYMVIIIIQVVAYSVITRITTQTRVVGVVFSEIVTILEMDYSEVIIVTKTVASLETEATIRAIREVSLEATIPSQVVSWALITTILQEAVFLATIIILVVAYMVTSNRRTTIVVDSLGAPIITREEGAYSVITATIRTPVVVGYLETIVIMPKVEAVSLVAILNHLELGRLEITIIIMVDYLEIRITIIRGVIMELEYLVAKIMLSLESKLALGSLDKEEIIKQLLLDSLAPTTIITVGDYSGILTRAQEVVY